MEARLIGKDDLSIGKPLTYPIYDQNGKLMLREGYVIRDRSELRRIVELMGIDPASFFGYAADYSPLQRARRLSDPDNDTPFELLDEVYDALEQLFVQFNVTDNFQGKVMALCNTIQQICYEDEDLSLGIMLMDNDKRYTIKHPVHTAIISEIIAKRLEWSLDKRQEMLAAALTMNLSVVKLQEAMYWQKDPPNEEQKKQITAHQQRTVRLLQALGVTKQQWLTGVFQHHEAIDGSGYPRGIKGDEICQIARIISLADAYSAMVSGRGYRPAMPANNAMRSIFMDKGNRFEEELGLYFIKTIGIYPPGTLVRLINGEIAVVTYRTEKANCPVVHSIQKSNGEHLPTPFRRDTANAKYAITEVIHSSKVSLGINRHQLWGYGAFKKMGSAKRRYDRVPTNIPAKIFDLNTISSIEVSIMNLSKGGCLIKIPMKKSLKKPPLLKIDNTYYLTFRILERTVDNIKFTVKNSKTSEDNQLVGGLFADLTEENTTIIRLYSKKMMASANN
ncbi:metal dependent phosphohydrolase [Candidatus Magnetobacterium bavaricum]|uniref:Metal dependent phosphohydrolase n=1 Tax=Candidatus Magnetobacterium bavaricum TaxID=29290 RepID=A0A0F3GUP3_9BACT|nr:metal dependent phosphohydrolase [Candidatus Magnetobacterium bavaricum]